MTYEMAGGGRAGLALALPDGTQLTLADRVARHLTTSLSTLRTAAANGRKLLADFAANRVSSGPARTYLWAGDRQESRALADLLAFHGVQVRQLAEGAAVRARPGFVRSGDAGRVPAVSGRILEGDRSSAGERDLSQYGRRGRDDDRGGNGGREGSRRESARQAKIHGGLGSRPGRHEQIC
jgi:hypothetical protein